MAKFEIADDITENIEGLYSNDKEDSGGETVLGICRSQDKDWKGWAIVDVWKTKPNFPNNLKDSGIKAVAQQYYKNKYWNAIRGDEIINQDEANQIYKSYVNTGSEGIILAQRALGIHESGKMDDITLNALNNK